ncbi:MAG: 3'-5' exoribonuclease YhaM family protein, partial [Gemmataceae bacterium]
MPALARLSELEPGQFADCFVLLAERTRGTTRDGKPFFTCRFRDHKRTASCMIWADGNWYTACEEWQPGTFYKVRILYGEHERYGPQFELHQIRAVNDEDRASGFDPLVFLPGPRRNLDALFAELLELVEQKIDGPLQKLVMKLLHEHGERFKRSPASRRHYHPYPGGLLEHTLTLAQNCLYLVDKYAGQYADMQPPLNRSLLLAAAVLHDIGRIAELSDHPFLPEPTVPGRLLGHIQLAREMVREAARSIEDLDPELLMLLDHLILSHLTLPEWGSPRLPVIAECLILHHADDLDAKMEMYARCLRDDKN